ncbi:MAG: hypothetical protein EBT26_08200 [Microbacteriaceae bacterium]|nr:hypothetical protein [Microbacteriaceae bacterium]NBS61999.1 hypothetical protein [Microbacteriaceae bacterium]
MTQDEIIEMARQAGLHVATDVNWMPIIGLNYAEAFAKLVAARTLMNIDPSKFISWQEAFEAGAAKEREACALIVEENANKCGVDTVAWMLLASNAEAIRARGQA